MLFLLFSTHDEIQLTWLEKERILFPGKEELGFVESVLKSFILIGQNIIRNK